ncbi:hypothetical protein AVEN_61625-1 [Araneus ventricosus]|uniref:RNase H type-1 domain-containing protein n=1 Tax=Araneus ventricosus TaxID=182803 RepID=A0A4Y2HIT7_ARAVE|nr:hypothetical protein AVEN_61625-1 [Araneus ventricosus]
MQVLWMLSERLSDETTVYMVETTAIYRSLNKMKDDLRTINIYADSRSVLMVLESFDENREIILRNKDLLQNISNVNLRWVKAHSGIEGNKMVDSLAKLGTEREEVDLFLPIPKSWVKNRINNETIKKWQSRWNSVDKSLHYMDFCQMFQQKIALVIFISTEF